MEWLKGTVLKWKSRWTRCCPSSCAVVPSLFKWVSSLYSEWTFIYFCVNTNFRSFHMKVLLGSLCSFLFRFFSMVTHGVICERICSHSCTSCHVLPCLKAAFLLWLGSLEDMIMICSLDPSLSPHTWFLHPRYFLY
jgi:hypothetical protein